MNTTNDEIEEAQNKILALIRALTVELSSKSEDTVRARSDLLSILAEEERILSQDWLDLDGLKMASFAVFRIVTDDDFQHTPLGKRFLEFSGLVEMFIRKNSEA
jgi:membrane protease subunit (stomatin/prohibitin family)